MIGLGQDEVAVTANSLLTAIADRLRLMDKVP
jgi:hypothetical protein